MQAPPPPPAPAPVDLAHSGQSLSGSAHIDANGKKRWDVVETESSTQATNVWSKDPSWSFDPFGTHVIHDLDKPISWSTAKGIYTTEDGSELFFVELEAGIVALKGSLTIASDIFANNLAIAAGLEDVPKMKLVVEQDTDIWEPMMEALWDLEQTKRAEGVSRENSNSKLAKSLLGRTSFILMEFVKGHDLQSLLGEEEGKLIKRILGKKDVLEAIGHLIAFDLYVNNWDRFPFVWQNGGNAKNVMFNVKKERVLGIDHTFTSIDPEQHGENCQKYLDSVDSAIADCIEADGETTSTTKVRNFLKEHSNVDIGEEGSLQIQKGLLKGVAMIGALQLSDILGLQKEVKNDIVPTTEANNIPVEATGLKRINKDFLGQMHSIFQKRSEQIGAKKAQK